MASRRTRIKGIANIPQRRKAANVKDEEAEKIGNSPKEELTSELTKVVSQKEEPAKSVVPSPPASASEIKSPEVAKVADVVKPNEPPKNEITSPSAPIVQPPKPPAIRRQFIKPPVAIRALTRTPKAAEEPKKPIENENLKKPSSSTTETSTPELFLSPSPVPAATSDLVVLPQNSESSRIPDSPINAEISKKPSYVTNSDTEYPPPPASPSKVNRSRIKAVPRFSQRKTSFSASESEDESRRHFNRNRNDSVCSIASGAPDVVAESLSPQRPREFNTYLQKKCRRTDQTRKLANARLDFYVKFGNAKPDRQKLTMIDLIFYNPTTNLMSDNKKAKKDDNEGETEEVIDDPAVETTNQQEADNPADKEESDEENEMPVPQIKIGPQGEIIIDEKSLIIENKETKKSRNELAKSKVVDGDSDAGYGVYKRAKRAKDWSHTETLRFYKALNTLGTDFTLMTELFPRRSRRELKMKFKKEEKINKALIDKAIMQPCNFDYAELKLDVEMEERELRQLENQKEQDAQVKKQKEQRISRKRKMLKMPEEQAEDNSKATSKPPKIRRAKKQRVLSINTILDNSDADESSVDSNDEREEVSMPLKPTRSGRVPKMIKKFDPLVKDAPENVVLKKKGQEDVGSNMEAGALVVQPGEESNGDSVLKVFMVTSPRSGETNEQVQVQNIFTITSNEVPTENTKSVLDVIEP